jgi:hypothetical protein
VDGFLCFEGQRGFATLVFHPGFFQLQEEPFFFQTAHLEFGFAEENLFTMGEAGGVARHPDPVLQFLRHLFGFPGYTGFSRWFLNLLLAFFHRTLYIVSLHGVQ